DVDHFKSVNDNHGHSMGDEVLKKVAHTISSTVRGRDIVCRYGGEEFCVLLPHADLTGACEIAERVRIAVAEIPFDELSVTASLGVSDMSLGAKNPQEMLDQADKCLYVAKRGGRNRVVRWDNVPDVVEVRSQRNECDNRDASSDSDSDLTLPYPAVASLLSALAYRDPDTAAHCTRVAELSVATARGLMAVKDAYFLEIAALLHDIGKIGVPDAILLKPGPLTKDEWEIMQMHDRIGVEIVEASFSQKQMVDIVRYHHATFKASPHLPHLPAGTDIPLGARIVTIADAYDAMVSDRVYRKGRTPEAAFQELRRCAGTQFDPELVERFIEVTQHFTAASIPISSKQVALQLGLQIERLARAVDSQDKQGIRSLASRLEATATHCRIPAIQNAAARIKKSPMNDVDMPDLVEMVQELIDLCRTSHKAYIDVIPRESTQDTQLTDEETVLV
ncbi:MAG: diguanylate cyclase, partial [Planctomycetales bacterium]|nr:diguanylate cyclase [Planctomycetales bacterium]